MDLRTKSLFFRPRFGNKGIYNFILTVEDDFKEDIGSNSYNFKLIVEEGFDSEDLFEEEEIEEEEKGILEFFITHLG